ncbi:MAG: hypothetical protein E6J91_10280 [Deltaproteobacteria bacterium]|nr:MAG: hypothetical protein E6J91_10280 [Deltaproteobacteria bacterium]
MALADLDEFRIVRPLGRGGMGELYVGHDTLLDRPVAIKLIGSPAPDATSRERFLTEARAIARLSHPNVVGIYRVGTTASGRPFLVQELIRGQSLDRVARPVPAPGIAAIAIGIARGLEAAHRRGILHRDIKPANVMLDEHGTARLLDFGLAKLTRREPDRAWQRAPNTPARDSTDATVTRDRMSFAPQPVSGPGSLAIDPTADPDGDAPVAGGPVPASLTVPGAVLGTPRYTAPELWRGEPATVRSDLYSLGALLYELAAGIAPYPETDLAELERAVLGGQARPVEELAPRLPPEVARVVMRCLSRDPAARPASAAEVAHALEAAVVGSPAIPEGNPYRGLRAFAAEHRGLFFGRGGDVDLLVDRFRTEALLVVAGDSGIGKSSVCHAGVVPAVVAGALGDHRRWRAAGVVPGRRPWDALRHALGIPAARDAEPTAALVRGARPPDGEGLVIVVDQLEELITVADPDQAARAAEALAAIGDDAPGLKALCAVRGDFLTRVAALADVAGLAPAMTRGLHLLRVLSRPDLREAVVGPARATGIAFESEAMIDALVDTGAAEPGALPLLAFALAELWQARDRARGLITRASLDALGGVAGALARRADTVLLELGAVERAAARSVLLRLVTPQHTRAVCGRDELVEAGASPAVLEALVRGRLVVVRDTLEGAPACELTHDALITSWGTLRDWLDDAAGRHAVHQRLVAAAAEWQRCDRRGDLLWNRRQLEEARDLPELTAHERAFVAASHRGWRRQRARRVAAVLALPVIALAIWAAVRIAAVRAHEREIAARVAAAEQLRRRADTLADDAARLRAQALASFDARRDDAGEARWDEARRPSQQAHAAYDAAEAELMAARADSDTVRDAMIRVLTAHAALARRERERERFDALAQRLAAYDPGGPRPWLAAGHLVVDAPRAVHLAVHRRRAAPGDTIAGGFDRAPIAEEAGGHLEVALAPGSYVVVARAPDTTVRDPVVIEPGVRRVRSLALPAARDVPAGLVYIPPGTFLYGSDRDDDVRRDFLYAQPLHEVATGAYLIARTEVTFADWIEYLRALPAAERAIRTPASPTVTLEDQAGGFALTLQPSGAAIRSTGPMLTYPARAGHRTVRWERLPVSGVSWQDALAYLAWLDTSGRVPGARPCTSAEWERAARGADGRAFPTGDTLAPGAANIDATYGRQPGGYGPDEVGSHPASDSPFGIADMAGNAFELIRGPAGQPWLKGGSWYQGAVTATASNRSVAEPTQRNVRIGLRVCAGAGPAR